MAGRPGILLDTTAPSLRMKSLHWHCVPASTMSVSWPPMRLAIINRCSEQLRRWSRLPPRVLCHEVTPVQTAMRKCMRDEGRLFEFGNQVLISNHRKLLRPKALVVNVAEKVG